ncbi:MAG: hydrogenase expression/formation protein HypE [Chlorobiaceae bacterium]|nr:hydrogenase expression/formation protein HypE [Chlorobiaceae bacterium]
MNINDQNSEMQFSCPLPIARYKNVTLAHGGGGKLMQQLIQEMFVSQFQSNQLEQLHDGAVFSTAHGRLAFTTDSYVVNPIFFPGGSIGELAVNGTVNDLAMCGAKPLYMSVGFIIEEGLSMDELWRIVQLMKSAAENAKVKIVTGDTKVVDRGKGDKIFINTSAIGLVPEGVNIDPRRAKSGDDIILSGSIAEHGIAIMSVREGLKFDTPVESDCAALNNLVEIMLEIDQDIHVMRDPTRGGVATVLNEIAQSAKVGILIDEKLIPVREEIKGACELLGLDPLYVANEGKLIAFSDNKQSKKIVEAMKNHRYGKDACIIGKVVDEHPGVVVLESSIQGKRIVDMISGEQLPRIC